MVIAVFARSVLSRTAMICIATVFDLEWAIARRLLILWRSIVGPMTLSYIVSGFNLLSPVLQRTLTL